MKIFYLINSRIPSEKAEGVEAMKLCEAFGRLAEVKMVAPFRFNKIKGDPFTFYGVSKNFKLIKLPVVDFLPFFNNRIVFWLEAISFSLISFFYILIYSRQSDIIFSHDQISIFPVSFFRKKVFYDIHDFPSGQFVFYKCLFKNLRGIVTTNKWKKTEITKKFGLAESKIISYPNGVDFAKFDIKISKNEARKKLKLPQDKFLIGYVGMLKTMNMEKGIDIALESLKYQSKDAILTLVGGAKEDIDQYKKLAEKIGVKNRVFFIGWVRHDLIPLYLKAFDVLIAPFPKNDHYNYYMCPMKIIEYMASGRPIVATNLNSIREILDENDSIFVKPNNEKSLAEGIKTVMINKRLSEYISKNAFNKAKNFSWERRAKIIVDFMIS